MQVSLHALTAELISMKLGTEKDSFLDSQKYQYHFSRA